MTCYSKYMNSLQLTSVIADTLFIPLQEAGKIADELLPKVEHLDADYDLPQLEDIILSHVNN